jgi:hypothetical protein
MNEEYLSSLYEWLGSQDSTYRKDVPYDQFISKMQDPAYVQKLHGWLVSQDQSFGTDLPLDAFNKRIRDASTNQQSTEVEKKNVITESLSGVGSSVSSASAEPKRTQFEYQPGKPLPKQIPSVQPDQPTRPQYTEEVMFGPMGISGVKTTGEAPEFQGKSIPKVVGEIGKVLTKGAVKFPADVLETAAIATAAARNLAAKTGIVDETSALDISIPMGGANVNFFQAASEWKDLVNDFIPTDKDIESGFWGQTANALGQMVPILLTGAISGGARAIAKEAGKKGLSMQAVANYGKNVVSRIGTPQGVLTISQVAAPSYEQAKLEGATENEALGYAIQNAVMTFPLEMLPVNNLFKRLDNVLVGNTGVEVLKRAVVGGGEEFITEGVQAVYENVTADAIYGTTRSFLDGVGESAAVGGTVGAIMNGVLTALLGRRARATSPKEIEEIDKSITDVEQKIAQVDSNNESLKETVKVLEETKPRVLSYGSANYNFIESPDGALEYADDALTEQQAQGIIGNLTNSYKKIDFKIEEVEPEDPYQPTTYKIIGTPKTTQQEVVQSGLTPEQRAQEIESIEIELRGDDNNLKSGRYQILDTNTRYNLEEKLQTLKAEEDAFQKQAAGQVPVQSGATVSQEVAQGEPKAEPQVTAEAGVQEEVTLSSKSIDDLERRQAEIEDSRDEKDRNEFNKIEKELENREWKSVLNSPIEEITGIVDSLIEKEKKKPNGFGTFIEPRDARETKAVAAKYSGEVSQKEAKKDFKDAFFGSPSTWYADGLKIRESVRAFVEQGGTFKQLLQSVQKEFESDGFSEEDAARSIKNRLDEVSRKNITEQEVAPVSPAVAPTTLTQQEQIAQMEQMFAEEEAPAIQPVQFEGATVSDPIQVESLKGRVQDKGKKAVVDFAQKTLTTLKSVLPEFEIVVHDDDNSYSNAMNAVNGNAQSSGYFSYIQRPDGTYVGKIDINLNKANNATVAHEVAHGVMRKAFGENVESFRTLKNRIASVLNTEGNQALTDFANQYEQNDSYEEYLVELAAQLTQAEKNLSPTLLQKIASIINEAVSKITNGAFTPFQNIRDTKQTIEFFRNISESIRKGEEINPADITAIQEGLSVPIGSPTTINTAPKGKASLNFTKTPLPLSFVTESDKIDINALIDDIVAKKQKIWFWMADQLGRGNYYDEVIEGEHYLDAGPSFALDPANRSKGILWASGLPEKTLTNQINQADYIFFISGSPEKAKLFNKRVLDLLAERINKTSNFDKFKEAINKFTKETVELRTIKDALNGVNSFKELADSPKRKPFLISIGEIGALKTAPAGSLKELLGSFNAFIDYNELRDGFYKENGFSQNDIMLVGKPTGVSGKAPHSTYEFAISGEVVGVPDKKVDSWDIMPEAIKEKYKDVIGGREEKTKPMQTKVIAAETGVIRELESRVKGKAQLIGQNSKLGAVVKYNLGIAKRLTSEGENPQKIRIETGWEQGKDKKWRYEIPDGKFKNFDINDLKIEKDIEDDAEIRVSILGDVFDSPDLYAAYPELKGIRVMFKKLPENVAGSYNPYTNAITVSIDDYLDPAQKEESELTMIHELQHAIQSKEYFERGGTEEIAQSFFDNLISNLKYDVDRKKEIYERAKAIFPNDKKKQQASRDLFKYALEKYTLLEQLGNRKETKANKKILAEWAKIAKEQGIKLPPKVKSRLRITPADSYNLYRRLAGEVEARNVEFRRSLTPDERRNTLLSETEEIDRADQLMLDNPDMMFEGIDEMNQQFKGKAQLDTDAKAKKVVQQARAQGFSEDAIQLFLQGKGLSIEAIDKAMAKETPAAGRIKLSEETIKGYDSLMKRIDTLIESGTPSKEVISKLKNSKTYINSTDVQKETLVRETRKKLGLRQKSAPKAERVTGKPVKKKVVVDEMAALKDQIKLESKAAREAKGDLNTKRKMIADAINKMAKDGKITAKKAEAIVKRAKNINVDSKVAVDKFLDYVSKVFADAEYINELDAATSLRSRIRSLSKNKDKAANLRSMASKFIEIDPSMVDDIYAYNEMARMIKESVEGSSIRGKDVKFANIVQEGQAIPYINKTLETQRKKLYEEKLQEVRDIIGIDAEGLSYEDLLTLLSGPKTKGKDNEKVVRDAINKAFEIYSSIINSSIETGVDPISGEKVSYTDSQKKLISQFMDMDLGLLSPKQALEAVDGLLNFIQNNSTAKMEAILKGYTGVKNAAELVRKGVKASPLRKYFSKGLGRFFGEQTTNLGLLFERLFKGFEAGGVVQDAMGLTDLINGKSQAQIESNRITNDYVSEFYKKKANGEAFNTELNNVERGMAAWMMRNVIGTEAEIKAEFQRRKDLILKVDKDGNRTGSIAELESGNEKEQAKAKVYQEVYDKILDGAKTIDDVMSKVDAVNLDAVKFWQNQWQNKYDELADVSLNVYNKALEKDINYTPDKYSKLSTSSGAVEITENDMAFHVNNGTLYDKETGVLMEATRPESLPVDNTTGEVDRYIDLSFDSNNANSMYDALVDIKTAGPIRQVQAFLNSKSFKKIFPQAEDATILKGDGKSKRIGRIELFTRNFRNKNPYSEDEFSNAVRNLNRLANVGVSQALGGVFQPIKQVIPVGMNTLINGGGLDIDAMTNPAKIKFMMDSGYAIGVRGVESQAQVESLNKLMDMATKSRGEKAMKYIEEANKIWLKIFLVKPDVFIARASWMTYYEQSLKKQGLYETTIIDTETGSGSFTASIKGIDYNTHELNEKAANYAQRMVDRQQNVSDADLSGKLFAEKNPGKQIMMKVFMPFASFRMNQSARIGADIATITSKVSTEEDRAIAAKSLAGFTVEMVTFRALSIGISLLTASVVAKMMGSEEEDEEKKKNSILKGQATNTISDVLSPIPFADPFVQAIAATTLQGAQDIAGVEEEDALSIYSPQDKGYLEQIGLFGFAAQRVVQTGELVWLSSVGSYRDSFGKKKYITPEDQDALRLLIGPALLTNVGLAPSEMNSVVRASMSAAKKNSSTKEGGAAGKDYESEMIDRIEEDLLEGYENKTELKRYNPRLYEQNFGEGSEYYELTKEKREEQKKAREEEQKEKDAEYGYRGKGKGFGSRSKSSKGGFGAKKFGED